MDVQAEYDLIIIGAGPAALALLARMLEERPAALYTDDERNHLSWLKSKDSPAARGRTTLKTYRSSHGVHIKATDRDDVCSRLLRRCACPRVLVIDKLGEGWLGSWNRSFKAFGITHLRSPMFFHPSPSALDDLLTYAQRTGRNRIGHPSTLYANAQKPGSGPLPDLVEICGVVGKEVSKHRKKKDRAARRPSPELGVNVNERSREDFFTPSTDLFERFVKEDVIDRYGLPGVEAPWKGLAEQLAAQSDDEHSCAGSLLTVAKGEVAEVSWHDDGTCVCGSQDSGFVLRLASGETVVSKSVVAAVGPGGRPAVPAVLKSSSQSKRKAEDASQPTKTSGPGWCHSFALAAAPEAFPPAHVTAARQSGQQTQALVIGGGLTSAQIADVCLKKGFDKVILVLRGHLKCKHFDFSTDWVGKYANLQKMRFWQEDSFEERLTMLREARNGGSITPLYQGVLKDWQAKGKLEIMTFSEMTSCQWIPERSVNEVTIATHQQKTVAVSANGDSATETITTTRNLQAHYIVSATGPELAFCKLPFMQALCQQHPIPMLGGLPRLTEDLQWKKDVPFFMIGAASALQIGPSAFNLGGIREAADRVAVRLSELSLAEDGSHHDSKKTSDVHDDYPLSFTHFGFEALSLEA